jgi:RimJ/RimL family protein N-acetyltransferase
MTGRAPLTDPGALLATTHDAGDGLRVKLRLSRPNDQQRVAAFLGGLSPETRRRRFFASSEAVPDVLVRHFTFFDPRTRLVVAATTPLDGSEGIVGLADVELIATGLAELGVVVDDRAQGRGLGKLLTEAVASLAIRQGANRLKAQLLSDNAPMLRLLEWLGPTVETQEDGNQVVYVELPAPGRSAA